MLKQGKRDFGEDRGPAQPERQRSHQMTAAQRTRWPHWNSKADLRGGLWTNRHAGHHEGGV
eukprot:6246302-Pyramimonas_sp.AAC.1